MKKLDWISAFQVNLLKLVDLFLVFYKKIDMLKLFKIFVYISTINIILNISYFYFKNC
jgi:hypothetical protein